MIEIVQGKPWRECQCCHSMENVIEVYFRDDGGQGACVSLCENCRRLLANLLIELTEKDERELSEDCEDCQEYDLEEHYCPRFCNVIRKTVDELNANAPKWIAVTERLPENYDEYLVTVEGVDPPGRYVTIWTYLAWCGKWADGDDDFVVNPDEDGVVTHWMEIPEPPKEDSDATY